VVPALIETGLENRTVCHPDAVSPVKVAWARSVPPEVHRAPMCVPVLVAAL
jgi:hypothetical protein